MSAQQDPFQIITMGIHQCMWIQWSILQNTTYILHAYYIHKYYIHTVHTTYRSDHIVSFWTKIRRDNKNQSKQVKIAPKTSENHSKKRVIFPERVKSFQMSDFRFMRKLTEIQLETKELSQRKKWNSLFWSDFHSGGGGNSFFGWFSLILGVIFTRLKWFLHFSMIVTLFTLREHNPFLCL